MKKGMWARLGWLGFILGQCGGLGALAVAHEGHDHGAPPPVVQSVAPRASTSSEDFELLVLADAGKLQFYLDRFRTNEPVQGARLEVDGAVRGRAVESAPGFYELPLLPVNPEADPLRLPLTITLEAGDQLDLLTTTLILGTPPVSPQETLPVSRRHLLIGVLFGLALLAGGWRLRRRGGR